MSIRIVQFTKEDIPIGKDLTDAEKWERSLSDWGRLLRLEPDGFFKADVDGEVAGIIGSIRYDRVTWINSLIVRKSFRGRHVGRALMSHCLDHAVGSGATTIKLDSVPGVEPFYERFGFRSEFPSLRFLGNVKKLESPTQGLIPPRLEKIIELDRNEIKIDRSKILKELFEEPTGRSFACGNGTETTGYLLTRQAQGRVDLGPCVVKNGDIGLAENLLRAATSRIGSSTFKLCVPGINRQAAGMIRSMGFEQCIGPTRMSWGEPFIEPPSMISMMSPEKG